MTKYNKEYFEYQKLIGSKNKNIAHRFNKYINSNSVVLDFGCGGGYLLDSFNCKVKIGIDINEEALIYAKNKGISTYSSIEYVEDESIDVVVSNSVLGHLSNPYETLMEIKEKMKINSFIIFSVPHETINWNYKKNEINYKFFTWSPMALGNLFHNVGFDIIKVNTYKEIAFPFELRLNNKFIFKILNLIRPAYRLFRIILDELKIYRIATDGDLVIYARRSK